MWNPPIELTLEEQKMAKRTRKARKFFVFLRESRHELLDAAFQEPLANTYRPDPGGKAPVEAGMLALATLVQASCHGSDRDAVELGEVEHIDAEPLQRTDETVLDVGLGVARHARELRTAAELGRDQNAFLVLEGAGEHRRLVLGDCLKTLWREPDQGVRERRTRPPAGIHIESERTGGRHEPAAAQCGRQDAQ